MQTLFLGALRKLTRKNVIDKTFHKITVVPDESFVKLIIFISFTILMSILFYYYMHNYTHLLKYPFLSRIEKDSLTINQVTNQVANQLNRKELKFILLLLRFLFWANLAFTIFFRILFAYVIPTKVTRRCSMKTNTVTFIDS